MTPDRYYEAFEAWGMVTLWKGPRDCAMGTLRCASSVPALGEADSHSYMSQWGQGGCWSAEVDHCVYPANNSSGSSVQEWASAITISLLNSFLSCSQHSLFPRTLVRPPGWSWALQQRPLCWSCDVLRMGVQGLTPSQVRVGGVWRQWGHQQGFCS